jgi:hypothetical protein
MHCGKTVFIASLCAVMALSQAAAGETIMVKISATAVELGGPEPDYFGVWFEADHDVRIQQIIYDLTYAQKALYYDIAPHGAGGYDFTLGPSSSPVGASALTAEGSPHLVINFTDFQPGEMLYFGIDVDGADCTIWTAHDFSGTHLGVLIDPAPAFPGLLPRGIAMQFQEVNGAAVASTQSGIPIPEPGTAIILTIGTLVGAARLRRRGR